MHGSSIGQTVYLRKLQQPDREGSSGCWIGGEPTLPPDIEWPYYQVHDGTSVPMHFLAQIDLGQVPLVFAQTGLPEHGTLFFFYDTIVAPCYEMGTKDECKVIYVEGDVSDIPTRHMPEFHIPEDYQMLTFWYASAPTAGYQRYNVVLTEDLDDEQKPVRRSFWEWVWGKPPEKKFQTSGHVNYLLGDPYIEVAAAKADDHFPLFTMFSDKDIGFQHGDQEGIVFLISFADYKNLNFDDVIALTDPR